MRLCFAPAAAVLLACSLPAFPASREPCALGYSMSNAGTILQQTGISGRQAFTPACFYADSFRYGVTLAGVDYFDPMDNMESAHLYQVALGGFFSYGKCTAKLAVEHFDALGVYFEQEGVLSVGTSLLRFVNTSIELYGYRAGLYRGGAVQTRAELGVSAMVPFRLAAVSLGCSHIPIKRASVEGYSSPLAIHAGVHSTANALGSQGILCEATSDGPWRFRLSIGEEYWLFKTVALAAAFTTNPVVVSFGVTVAWRSAAMSAGFADHPVLGWSKGLAIDWAGK
jgi:hypothetical protein